MAKIQNDKYYTSPDLAEYCVKKTREVIGEDNIIEYIEPSAGSGVFLDYLDKPYLAYDIEPEDDRVVKADWLGVDLDYKKIQRYIDTKHQSGRLNGNGGLSARSLKLHKNIINQTLNLAVQNRLIPSNPCQFVVLPQCERYESKFYNDRQLRELFSALDDDPLLPLVKITALYGLRRSELLGLQWDSIDFERKSMTIRHTVSKVTEVVAKDKTKNASSRRTFPLTSEAVEIFTVAKRQEQRNRTAFGNEYQENNYVFKWPDGHTYSPDYVSHRFNDLLKKHSLPHIRFHELRHSCASMLIAMGWSLKDVQEWLGHSDVKMTANIYAHLDTTRKNNIAESLAEKFGA